MEKIKLLMEIKSSSDAYCYKGFATLNKDIIRYENLDEEVIFDTRIDRIIKKEKDKKITIDFQNSTMKIEYLSSIMNFDIKIYEYKKSENNIEASYSVDSENVIKLKINIKKYLGKED